MLTAVALSECRFMGTDASGERIHMLVLREVKGIRRCALAFSEDFVHFIRSAQDHLRQGGIPLFHSAALDLLVEAGYQLHHLVIPGLVGPEDNKRYRMILHFQLGNRNVEKEFLPSDALAFALYADCPILVEDAFLTEAEEQATEVIARYPHLQKQGKGSSATDLALNLPKDKLPQA